MQRRRTRSIFERCSDFLCPSENSAYDKEKSVYEMLEALHEKDKGFDEKDDQDPKELQHLHENPYPFLERVDPLV